MNKKEFLSMMAFENSCGLISSYPKDYGFSTWTEAYEALKECDETAYHKDGAEEEFWLTDEMSYGFTLGAALVKAYNEAEWVLRQAKVYEVKYEG